MNLQEIKSEIKKLSYEDTRALDKIIKGFLTAKKMSKKQLSDRGKKGAKARWSKKELGVAFGDNITKKYELYRKYNQRVR